MIAAGILLVGVPGAWLLARGSGELRAQRFVQITAPANAQQAQVYQMKIASIVPEGTTVKAGDVVAELDRASDASTVAAMSLAVQMDLALEAKKPGVGAGQVRGVTDPASGVAARHGDLREKAERQEAHGRLTGVGARPRCGNAAGSQRHGVGDLRE